MAIRVLVTNANVVIEISDTGMGIPESKRQFVFEEFVQLNNPSRDRSKGLGLGLAIVKRFSELMKMRIDLQSNVGEGTIFTLHLERLYDSSGHDDSDYNASIVKDLKILVVDDDATVADAITTLLRHLGCDTASCNSLSSALELFKKNKPDIIITDYRLGDNENGIMLIDRARKLFPNMPAILVSGATDPEHLMLAKKAV